ncbi:MAG TPA: aldo/keto reductase [Verrucomicrobiales bacterium]|jgi:aryl-alcohol dehydrogenase-like predicted oxidoreductase|nr:aldo/keto reductase [Verrucomicrobiales bacterium]
MEYRQLGNTEISVSVMALGCWTFAGDSTWGEQTEKDSIDTVHAAMDEGINFFDTAEMYGDGLSDEILGKSLKNRRDKAVISSKALSKHAASDDIVQSLENSLRRIGTDYIDLFQLHWPNAKVPVEETLGALTKLKQEGKIRAVGFCNIGRKDLEDWLRHAPCDLVQLPYSLLFRAVEFEITPFLEEKGIGMLVYSPLLQGVLTGKFDSADAVPEGRARTRHFSLHRPKTRHSESGAESETFGAIDSIREICESLHQPIARVSLAWILSRPSVVSLICGARSPNQIQENAKAVDMVLSPELVEQLTEATEELKKKLGRSVDLWQSDSRIR